MGREQFYSYMLRYFDLSQVEVEKMLHEKFKKEDEREKLIALIETTLPYFEPFVNQADEKLKRKVGKVFLSKLDYSQFYDKETVEQMRNRIKTLLRQTSSKGINTYKILYCSVLTDGNLKRDNETRSKYYDSSRDFELIYDSLKSALGLTDAQTVECFERCSSLISKGFAYKFPHIYNKLNNLIVYEEYGNGAYKLFKPEEVGEALLVNLSLFLLSTDRIQDAFDYVQRKMSAKWKIECDKVMETNPNMTQLVYKTIQLRKCFKNNLSLFAINSSNMNEKEKHLKDTNILTDRVYASQFRELFETPINLAIINQIPTEKVARNALLNLRKLESVVSDKSKIGKYILKNQYIIGMDNLKFSNLIDEISLMEKSKPEEKYLERFLEFGKTLFSSNIDFNVATIVDKLKNNSIIIDIDVDSLSDRECLHEFVEIFFDGNHEIARQIEELIRLKVERNKRGERELRKEIRTIGKQISDLPKLIKDEKISLRKKKDQILKLTTDISSLHERRYNLLGYCSRDNIKYSEQENSHKIEKNLNILRTTFEEKRFKVGKKYSNVEDLYTKMMDFLSSCFDDKEAITDLFKKEILDSFHDFIETSFDIVLDPQQSLFGKRIIVDDAPSQLVSPLKKMNQEVSKVDAEIDTTFITFEK